MDNYEEMFIYQTEDGLIQFVKSVERLPVGERRKILKSRKSLGSA